MQASAGYDEGVGECNQWDSDLQGFHVIVRQKVDEIDRNILERHRCTTSIQLECRYGIHVFINALHIYHRPRGRVYCWE